MPRFNIPTLERNKFTGIFPGELSGEIWLGKNIDLERSKSKIQIADSFSALKTSADVGFSSLTTPIAFVRSSADNTDKWWTNAGLLYKTSGTNPESGWVLDAIASSPTTPLYDMIDFAGNLIVPISTDLSRLVAGTWTSAWWTSLTGASALQALPHRFSIFEGALCFTDGRFVNDYDGTIARDPALTLPVGFEARWLLAWRNLLFVGGADTSGREANIYSWRRELTTYESAFPIGDTEALCGFIVSGIPHIVTKKGAIKRFNGTGFELVQQFPTVELNKNITLIHPNGVSTQENIAKMLVNFGVSADMRVLSGLWTFDAQNKNLYHSGSVRNSIGNDYAQHELSDVGALTLTVPTQGSYLLGARPYIDYGAATTRYGIFSSDEELTSNRGYFITPKIPSANASNYWRYLWTKFAKMTSAGDRIRVYYRSEDTIVLYPNLGTAIENITWLSASQFTGSNLNAVVGDLVEILAGDNAGAIARITAISSGTFTITPSLFSSTAVSRARYLRFNEIGSISSQTIISQRFVPATRSPWIQYLIYLEGSNTSPSLERLLLDYDGAQL